jgi:four helix bundle protein
MPMVWKQTKSKTIMAFNFEKLRVWQLSVEFAAEVYDLTKKFPKDERFNLTSQTNRAADSISLNIAEGSTGQTKREFARFLGYAIRSGIEVVGCLYLTKRKGFIDENEFKLYYNKSEKLIVQIQSLRKSVNDGT